MSGQEQGNEKRDMTENKTAYADAGVPIEDKVRFLSDPGTYGNGPFEVEIVETHMSWVFLVGPQVFKLKKPVQYDFLDFSTLEKRALAVRDEVDLNRRLASDVYAVPRPLVMGPEGRLTLDAAGGPVVEWLVEMRRLPEARNLERMIGAGELTPAHIGQVAGVLRGFYRALSPAEITPEDYAAQFAAEFTKTRAVLTDPALALGAPQLDAALDAYDRAYAEARPLLLRRVSEGQVVEGHGDLRPEHVFLTDPPVIIDCLEFNRTLRLVDPLDEIAFLGMECARLGPEWGGWRALSWPWRCAGRSAAGAGRILLALPGAVAGAVGTAAPGGAAGADPVEVAPAGPALCRAVVPARAHAPAAGRSVTGRLC